MTPSRLRGRAVVIVGVGTLVVARAGYVRACLARTCVRERGVISGPDGNLWFTEANRDKIGRITTSGQITEFPIPTTNSAPFSAPTGITPDPEGYIWFADSGGNVIARITKH